jgi:hypothetical protein
MENNIKLFAGNIQIIFDYAGRQAEKQNILAYFKVHIISI